MKLEAGTRLGPYEVLSALGAGGMGEVYRARDTRLGRDVAVKILAESFVHDPDRIARFQREAQVLAALNHPHIAHIYGLEETAGSLALVMELVDGQTLADRIAQGAIPLDEALPIARQIADALEAAHDQGIVHRDLKPANISIRSDGTVKVLDFGLAKLAAPAESRPEASLTPTITSPALMTGVGMILGTAAYMAPEQARGKTADKRSDVWAFGCVLYEMLTGRRVFAADEVSDTLAMVLMKEPDWSLLPASTPSAIRTLLRRCLEKDRKKRMPDIGAVRLEIDEALTAPRIQVETSASRRGRQWIAWATATAGVAAALAISVVHFTEPAPAPSHSLHFSVSAPANNAALELSPDGLYLLFAVGSQAAGDRLRLAIRAFDADDVRELPGTDGAASPFWSSDSRYVGFVADGMLKKINVTGGPSQVICTLPGQLAGGGTWNRSGTIVFASNAGGLFQVSAAGGTPAPVTKLDAAKKEVAHQFPWFLPDGQHFLYIARSADATFNLFVGSLDGAPPIALWPTESKAVYADGYVLFSRQGALLAQPFDADRHSASGDPIVVVQDVNVNLSTAAASFSVATRGLVAYRAGIAADRTQLALVDRSGKPLGMFGEPLDQTALELSPDAARVAISVVDASRRTRDIWIHDLKRNVRARYTFDAGEDWTSTWSPDGTRLAFSAGRPSPLDLYQQAANGSSREERLLGGGGNRYASSWSPDGRFIMYHTGNAGSQTGNDIWVLPTSGDRKPRPFLETRFNETEGRFSPDGRWVAYRSNESGRDEVYVMPFPGPGGKWQVSTAGGVQPRWRRDGKELFYLAGGNAVMSADVNGSGAAFEVGAVRRLFEARLRMEAYRGFGQGDVYDVFPDGQRFLIDMVTNEREPQPFRVITNWTSTLR